MAHNQKVDQMHAEAGAVAKFLMGLDMKMKRTQLVIEQGPGQKKPVNCEYVTGTDLHLAVMTHKD